MKQSDGVKRTIVLSLALSLWIAAPGLTAYAGSEDVTVPDVSVPVVIGDMGIKTISIESGGTGLDGVDKLPDNVGAGAKLQNLETLPPRLMPSMEDRAPETVQKSSPFHEEKTGRAGTTDLLKPSSAGSHKTTVLRMARENLKGPLSLNPNQAFRDDSSIFDGAAIYNAGDSAKMGKPITKGQMAFVYSVDGKTLLWIVTPDGSKIVTNLKMEKPRTKVQNFVHRLFSLNGSKIVTKEKPLRKGQMAFVYGLDGKLLWKGKWNGERLANGTKIVTKDKPLTKGQKLVFSPDGSKIVGVEKPLTNGKPPTKGQMAFVYSVDGKKLLWIVTPDGSKIVTNLKMEKPLTKVQNFVHRLFSLNGSKIVTKEKPLRKGQIITLWGLDGKILWKGKWDGKRPSGKVVGFSPDGKILFSPDGAKIVRKEKPLTKP